MHSIENIINDSVEKIRGFVDVDAILGTPIVLGGEDVILPVSKVSVGFISGGGEYGAPSVSGGVKAWGREKSVKQAGCDCDDADKSEKHEKTGVEPRYPFSGAAVAGMTLSPVAFLTVSNGDVRVLPVQYDTVLERVIDAVPPFVNSIIDRFSKDCEDCQDN